MVGTCRKRSISAPELETSIHERWEQKLAKDISGKQQKISYHSHVYVNNVGSCNFLCLFPCSLTYLMFPCSLRFFLLYSRVPIAKFPVFPCSPKTPGGPSTMIYQRRQFYHGLSMVLHMHYTGAINVQLFNVQLFNVQSSDRCPIMFSSR